MKRVVMMAALAAGTTGVAHAGGGQAAKPAPPPPSENAWSKGVTKADQDRANGLYEEGNTLFGNKDYPGALDKYQAALAIWKHPQIELNAAVTLARLNRSLEASEMISDALRFDAAPFERPEDYQKALDDQALINGALGTIEVTCGDKAQLTLDGKPWFECPGTQSIRVLAGEHTVVGEEVEFVPRAYRIGVSGGQTAKEKVVLIPLESAVTIEYKYPRWLPFTVAGGGAAIALGGIGFYLHARSQMDKFNANFMHDCASGCAADLSDNGSLKDQRDSAKFQGNTIGIPMIVVGGTAVVGGIVLAIINRPRRVLPKMEVMPTAGGMQAAVGWQF